MDPAHTPPHNRPLSPESSSPDSLPLRYPSIAIPLEQTGHTSPAPPLPPLPHPHLSCPVVYINLYPADLSESLLYDCLPGCSFQINLYYAVQPHRRLLPDIYYNWMTKSGTLHFSTLADAEKALAILPDHPQLAPRGIWVSPLPPQQPIPLHASPTSERYIHPTHYAGFSPQSPAPISPPTSSELYDTVRPWGSLKSISTWATDANGSKNLGKVQWFAKVEFWYSEEAQRFQIGFGQLGCLIKGWQVLVSIWGNAAYSTDETFSSFRAIYQPPITPPQSSIASNFTFGAQSFLPTPMPGPNDPSPPPLQIPTIFPQTYLPPTPPKSAIPPWAGHNPYAYNPDSFALGSLSGTPNASPVGLGSRRSFTCIPGAARLGHRRWSLTVGETSDGMLLPTGLVADDGTVIQHGPGQHIRPAPAFGPGSSSVSGLVDYSNVFVKNLDPDINSYYLDETFSQFGRVVSARVMRDDLQRSRGYGFVSFYTPEEAANAIKAMNGAEFGSQILSVTLHEPRKLRPEKIAERAQSNPMSPTYRKTPSNRLGCRSSDSIKQYKSLSHLRSDDTILISEPADDISLLSPASRKLALSKKLIARVKHYVKKNSMSDDLVEPVVNALLPSDIALLPFLHNRWDMDKCIEETLAAIREDSETDQTHVIPIQRPTEEDLSNLRTQIDKIDPINCKEVMNVLLEILDPEDWENELSTKVGVAIKYGTAKKILSKRQDEAEKGTDLEKNDENALMLANSNPQADVSSETLPARVPLDEISLPLLASLSAMSIIFNLSGGEGRRALERLNLKPPSEYEQQNLAIFKERMKGRKGKLGMRGEVVTLLSRYVECEGLKRSEKIKIMGEFANQEDDDESLCLLALYPALLNAKVKAYIDSRCAP
nr:hypothetical protein L203_05681 [Cryptococcus depauperatus CBS 7841]